MWYFIRLNRCVLFKSLRRTDWKTTDGLMGGVQYWLVDGVCVGGGAGGGAVFCDLRMCQVSACTVGWGAAPVDSRLEAGEKNHHTAPPPTYTHTHTSQQCTTPTNMPTSTQMDDQQSLTSYYALQLCSQLLWIFASVNLPLSSISS